MREFTDPFTGEKLDNPTEKRYRVRYSYGNNTEETTISTLSDAKMTKQRAKQKINGPLTMMVPPNEITVESIDKIDEVDKGGSSVFGFE
jgi:hypothetical protein